MDTYQLSSKLNSQSPQGPYLIAPATPAPATPLLISVPGVNGKDAANNTGCAVSTDAANVDFSLSWKTLQRNNQLNVFAQVQVAAAHVWSDDPNDRQILRNSFTAFCTALQKLELQAQPQCLAPGGAAFLAQQVAAALPLRVDEVLFYYYNLTPASNYLDLQPGMRLRLETGSYQYISAPSTLNAFSAQGQCFYYLGRNSQQQLCFDPFLNGLGVQIAPTSPPRLGNLLDLTALGAVRYLRLIYPAQMNNPTNVANAPGLAQNAVLLGADTPDDLAQATNNYLANGVCSSASPGQRLFCAYFTGRNSVIPEIAINVQGETIFVPVGTTVQHILDRYCLVPPAQLQNYSAVVVSFNRMCLNGNSNSPLYNSFQVNFMDATDYIPVPGSKQAVLSQWDLPLVIGDGLAWAPSNQSSLSNR